LVLVVVSVGVAEVSPVVEGGVAAVAPVVVVVLTSVAPGVVLVVVWVVVSPGCGAAAAAGSVVVAVSGVLVCAKAAVPTIPRSAALPARTSRFMMLPFTVDRTSTSDAAPARGQFGPGRMNARLTITRMHDGRNQRTGRAACRGGFGLLIQPLLSASFGCVWLGEQLSLAEAAGMVAILVASFSFARSAASATAR